MEVKAISTPNFKGRNYNRINNRKYKKGEKPKFLKMEVNK